MSGTDLSNNNGGAFPDATEFAFLKAAEGKTFDDKTFEGYVEQCTQRGIPWGPYHFPHPDANTPEAEAAWFLRHAQRGPLGWALDIETRDGGKTSPLAIMGAQALADWSERFRELVEGELGRSWFYTFRSYAGFLFPRLSDEWTIWLATATGHPGIKTFAGREIAVEQYGQADGFDVNVAWIDLAATPIPPSPRRDDKVIALIKGDNDPAGTWYLTDYVSIKALPGGDPASEALRTEILAEIAHDVIQSGGIFARDAAHEQDQGGGRLVGSEPLARTQALVDALK